MDIKEAALKLHKELRGKIEIKSKYPIKSLEDLTLLYTPGVAAASMEIFKNKNLAYDYTSKWNTVAIVTDGSRVLGLGDIGPEAALPVMEGKALLFKLFGDVDAIPICLATQDTDEIINIVKKIAPTFGGINIEDIDSPRCFEIVDRLEKELDIPVFHDDQHGTGVVTLAALSNALILVDKKLETVKIVIAGAGSAGTGVTKILLKAGAKNIIVTDSKGVIFSGRTENMNPYKEELANTTNPENLQGDVTEALKGADVLIALNGKPNSITVDMIRMMSKNPIVFALGNPEPEILPNDAKECGAKIVATGRSDFPNQVNNSLAFPAIFRAVFDARLEKVTDEMKLAAAYAIADFIPKDKLNEDYIVPRMTDKGLREKIVENILRAANKN
ncbi:MAG: NADP-dependent malic enzyme [Candidatus Aenigmarchaeota archaeon]|nr:NADP-dependent malic enzyme [Candidatus Aenigmarchaeota archaeon]